LVARLLLLTLALASTADAQVWTPKKRAHVHAMSTTIEKTRKPVPEKAKREKSKVVSKKKRHGKRGGKKHHRSGDDFTYSEEDYPAN